MGQVQSTKDYESLTIEEADRLDVVVKELLEDSKPRLGPVVRVVGEIIATRLRSSQAKTQDDGSGHAFQRGDVVYVRGAIREHNASDDNYEVLFVSEGVSPCSAWVGRELLDEPPLVHPAAAGAPSTSVAPAPDYRPLYEELRLKYNALTLAQRGVEALVRVTDMLEEVLSTDAADMPSGKDTMARADQVLEDARGVIEEERQRPSEASTARDAERDEVVTWLRWEANHRPSPTDERLGDAARAIESGAHRTASARSKP